MSAFIALNSQDLILKELQASIRHLDKMVLLIGKSGSGKSFLLEHLAKTLPLHLFLKPFFSEEDFCLSLSKRLFNKKLSFTELYEALARSNENFILVFDELGLYDEKLLERLRFLSELKNLQLILSTHKKQSLLKKEYFSSRISKELVLKLDSKDLLFYVEKKHDVFLSKRALNFLLKISFLNLRIVDKILKSFKQIRLYYKDSAKSKKDLFILKLSALHHDLLR